VPLPSRVLTEPAPWDDLADAFEQLARSERHGTTEDIAVSRANLERAKDRMAALGQLVALYALEPGRCGLPLQRRLAQVFGDLAQAAWDRATRAAKRATWAVNELDALKRRVIELEELVARVTPGIGEPRTQTV
jgi:hypothetical protein